jgi:hypothetical protein
VTEDEKQRQQTLAEFDEARQEFQEAVRRAPDAALRYRPAGEDYALGGLVIHVTDVLKRYTGVLEAIHAANWQEPIAPEHRASAEETALIRDGFAGDMRSRVLEEMRSAHAALVDAVNAEPADWFRRQTGVTYSGSSEPYPTSPADVVGWVRDHYNEHTQQVADLVSEWAAATR